MVQFNLLPDVKIEFIKARNRKRLIVLIASIVSVVAFTIFALLFLYVRINQPAYMKALDSDISTNANKIKEIKDLDKILTIQNQLKSLPDLHSKKMVSSRLVDFLTKVTPNQSTISEVSLDFDSNTLSIKGNADNLTTINKFTDNIKFTDYKVNSEGGQSGKAFKNVVLQSFAYDGTGAGSTVSYTINLEFEPVIFSQVQNVAAGKETEPVTLTVPKIISTRSETEKPANLFSAPQPQQNETPEGGQ